MVFTLLFSARPSYLILIMALNQLLVHHFKKTAAMLIIDARALISYSVNIICILSYFIFCLHSAADLTPLGFNNISGLGSALLEVGRTTSYEFQACFISYYDRLRVVASLIKMDSLPTSSLSP